MMTHAGVATARAGTGHGENEGARRARSGRGYSPGAEVARTVQPPEFRVLGGCGPGQRPCNASAQRFSLYEQGASCLLLMQGERIFWAIGVEMPSDFAGHPLHVNVSKPRRGDFAGRDRTARGKD